MSSTIPIPAALADLLAREAAFWGRTPEEQAAAWMARGAEAAWSGSMVHASDSGRHHGYGKTLCDEDRDHPDAMGGGRFIGLGHPSWPHGVTCPACRQAMGLEVQRWTSP